MISFDSALEILSSNIPVFNFPEETLEVNNAFGRVIAKDQISLLDLPSFDKAMMDGYAILGGDERAEYQLLEVVAAGQIAKENLVSGTAIKIMTGAKIPSGTEKIIPIENTEEISGRVKILSSHKSNNIARRGEDVRVGNIILKKGRRLNAEGIANLVASGITKIKVFKKPKIIIISTGDELVSNFADLKDGKIMDSNYPMLVALCKQYGLEVEKNILVKDDSTILTKILREKTNTADLIILSAGVSAGDFDFVAKALSDADFKIHFNRVAIKPGKPTTFATKNNQLVFALPGNPVAVFLTFHLFILHALNKFFKSVAFTPKQFSMPLGCDFKRKSTDRMEYVPCTIQENGTLLPVKFHGSAHLAALLACDGFFVINKSVEEIKCGEQVKFIRI